MQKRHINEGCHLLCIYILKYYNFEKQAVFMAKTGCFWVIIKRVFADYPSELFYAFMLQDITQKGVSFFPEKIKKIINLYIFVFYFYFFWKKEFDLFTAILQQGCISLHSLSLKGHKLVTYWIYDIYIVFPANSGSFLHCLWWQGDKQVCKLFIYT